MSQNDLKELDESDPNVAKLIKIGLGYATFENKDLESKLYALVSSLADDIVFSGLENSDTSTSLMHDLIQEIKSENETIEMRLLDDDDDDADVTVEEEEDEIIDRPVNTDDDDEVEEEEEEDDEIDEVDDEDDDDEDDEDEEDDDDIKDERDLDFDEDEEVKDALSDLNSAINQVAEQNNNESTT